ncbi:MAG: MMPL family transporter [Acidimicrobiia bacterium]|nr:MMPL family transporter [Acidimicrobiia bacterium]
MSRLLFRLGHASARHPWRVLLFWVLAAVATVGVRQGIGGEPNDDFQLPGTETQAARDLLEERFPEQAGTTGQVVFAAETGVLADAGNRAAVEATLGQLASVEHVVDVSDPFDARGPTISPDGRIGFTTLTFDEQTLDKEIAEATEAATEVGRDAGVQVEVSGTIMASAQEMEGGELVGLAVAVVVLLVAFGSLVATGIPIGTALFGLFIGLAGVGILSGITDVPTVSPMLATMIGLGVGIDYALFVVTRHRQFLHEGWSVPDAAGRANATAGQSVLFAGMTVVIAIMGLIVAGIPSIATMGYAAAIVVLVAMAGAITLLPAFLGLAGHRIDSLRVGRRRGLEAEAHRTVAGRWADRVGRRPWPYALVSFGLLVALGAPLLSMRVGFADDGNQPADTTARKAYDLLAEGFGVGFNGPLTVVVDLPTPGAGDEVLPSLTAGLAGDPGLVSLSPAQLNPSGDTAVLFAFPATAPQDEATSQLVHRLRDDVIPVALEGTGAEVHLAGWQAAQIDISERMSSRLPAFVGAVVGLSFLLLMVVFRSVLVPLKAAVMNLLSIGAAYGVVVAVFQWGWMKDLVGLEETVPVFPFLPMIMFAILFGLSMDYEVFLLSRVREAYVRSGDSHRSVVEGLASTARVITSAALIMISVFGAFVLSSDVILKMFGLGLATAVLVDATVVRMVLVPATMALLGNANWWLPRWLDRLLPHVDMDGAHNLGGLGGEAPDQLSAREEELEPVGA